MEVRTRLAQAADLQILPLTRGFGFLRRVGPVVEPLRYDAAVVDGRAASGGRGEDEAGVGEGGCESHCFAGVVAVRIGDFGGEEFWTELGGVGAAAVEEDEGLLVRAERGDDEGFGVVVVVVVVGRVGTGGGHGGWDR